MLRAWWSGAHSRVVTIGSTNSSHITITITIMIVTTNVSLTSIRMDTPLHRHGVSCYRLARSLLLKCIVVRRHASS
ncbi:MAG: hypothetical protein JNL12_20990 [Planctomycetes bacterium]|nr:hypothetical protein [Planctomycetota bacterium]